MFAADLTTPEGQVPKMTRTGFSWNRLDRRAKGSVVELCSGMGGIGLGLRPLGLSVLRAYDNWPPAVAVYNHNAGRELARCCDLLTSAGRADVAHSLHRDRGIDLLAAGPPCKGFSQLQNGRHSKPNPHNRLLTAIPDYAGLLKPRLVLIENVPDLIRHRKGATLRTLISKLTSPGPRNLRYQVTMQTYDAAQVGVPQVRRRLLILAVREGTPRVRLPPGHPNLAPFYSAIRRGRYPPRGASALLRTLQNPQSLSMTASSQALSDLPRLLPGQPESPRDYAAPPSTTFQRLMRTSASDSLSNTKTPAVLPSTVARLKSVPPGGCARDIPLERLNGLSRRFGSAYRRLHPDAPSTALSTKYDCVYHYEFARSLSVREYSRLQGIPDFIDFPASLCTRRAAYELIGNSVPPLLVYAVLRQVLAAIGL